MKSHLRLLWSFSRNFSRFFLFLSLLSNAANGDDISELISKSEASSESAANEASGLIGSLRNNSGQESALDGVKSPPSDSTRKYPKQEPLKNIPLTYEGKKKCKDKAPLGSGKCPSSLLQGLETKQVSNSSSDVQLLIFVSQSVPAESIKELWHQAYKIGGKLLFRGLIGGSFKETQTFVQDMGIIADIDPTKFEEFEITHVPACVLAQGHKHDKLVGNISLKEFLGQSSISGDLKKEASDLLNKLQEVQS